MAHIGEQIKKYRTIKGIRQKDLAEKIGVSNKRLSNWERGLSMPKQDMVDKICEVLEVDYFDLADMIFEAETTFDYLDLHGEVNSGFPEYYTNQAFLKRFNALDKIGRKFVFSALEHEEERMEQLKKLTVQTLSQPVFTLAASAGTGQFLDSDEYELVDFPEEAVPRESTFGVRVSGNSMEPEYKDGSIVFVKRSKNLNVGDVGIFILNDEGYLKILGDNNILKSLNPDYEDIQIHEWDDCRIVGKVVGKFNNDN